MRASMTAELVFEGVEASSINSIKAKPSQVAGNVQHHNTTLENNKGKFSPDRGAILPATSINPSRALFGSGWEA